MYFKRGKEALVILTLYVDDIIIFSTNNTEMNRIIKYLKETFEMVSMGEPKRYLGIEIDRDLKNNVIKLYQTQYIQKLLKRFMMFECNPSVNTIHLDNELPLSESETKLKRINYQEKIGYLLYIANCTIPDIAFPTNWLSRKQLNCTVKDVKDVGRILRYLKGTINKGFTYTGKTDEITAFADASYVSDMDTGSSTSGVINWISRRQKVKAT